MNTHNGVASLRRFLDHASRNEIGAMLDMMCEDIVVTEADSLPFGGEHRGKDAWVALSRRIFGGLINGRVELKAVWPGADNTLAALMEISGTSKRTGEAFTTQLMEIWTFRDDLIASVKPFYHDTHRVRELF